MNVEIINVGTELLLGEIINTNATFLQNMCKELGLNVFNQQVVGDNPDRVKEALEVAFQRGADCIITTGGLGPTQDDLTKEISTEFLGLELAFNQEEADKVMAKLLFLTFGEQVTPNNLKQAFFPKECIVLENNVGTANGCIMENNGRMIVNLPGPPKEMVFMVDNYLRPYLEQFKSEVLYSQDIYTLGIGESAVAHELDEIINNQSEVSIALYASEISVRIRLAVKSLSQDEANGKMVPVRHQIEAILGKYIVGKVDVPQYVYDHIPPYQIVKPDDLDILLLPIGPEQGTDLVVTLGIEDHELGHEIAVTISYGEKQAERKIRFLGEASYSKQKIEHRILELIAGIL